MFTPLWVNVGAGSAGLGSAFNENTVPNAANDDVVGLGGGSRTLDTTGTDLQVYAVWSPSAVVPVPAAVWLFGSGLLGLIGMARRKKA